MTHRHPFSTFESELIVRPDDIDMNNHVHNSKYLDYVLAARYDQMERCYKMSMQEFLSLGLTWVVTACFIQFKRSLVLGDTIIVKTGIEKVGGMEAKVKFSIVKKATKKLSAEGYFEYKMINVISGRAEKIPEIVVKKYSI